MLPTPRLATNKIHRPHAGLLAALALAALLAAGCNPSGPDLIRKGQRLLEEGRAAEAVEKLEGARDLLPDRALVWNQLGLAYHAAGRPKDAAQAYSRALQLDRNLFAARFNLGCLALEQGNLPSAISDLTAFTSLQPGSADGWLKLAIAQYRARQYDAAERSLVTTFRLRPKDPAALNTAGLVALARRRAKDAASYFEAALQSRPGFAPALLNLAVTHHQHLNDKRGALEQYRAYLKLAEKPANWEAVNEIAQQLDRELNPPPKPVTVAPAPSTQQVTRVTAPAPAPRTNLAAAAFTNNRPAQLTQPPVTQQVSRVAAPAAVASARPATNTASAAPMPAQKVEVVALPPDEPIKPASNVTTAPKPKESPPVIATPKVKEPPVTAPVEVAEPAPKRTFLQRMNPVRWFSRSETNRSTELKVEPQQPTTAKVARRIDPEPPKGEPLVRETPNVTPLPAANIPPQARYRYVRPKAAQAGNRSEAERYFARGTRNQREGRLTAAVTEYLAAVQADGTFFEAHYNLGLAAFELGHMARSLSAYEHALSINPTHLDARFNFALALQKGNYPRDAANELEKLLADNPNEARAHLALANLLAQSLGQAAEAKEHYLRVLKLDPRNPEAPAIRYWISTHP